MEVPTNPDLGKGINGDAASPSDALLPEGAAGANPEGGGEDPYTTFASLIKPSPTQSSYPYSYASYNSISSQ